MIHRTRHARWGSWNNWDNWYPYYPVYGHWTWHPYVWGNVVGSQISSVDQSNINTGTQTDVSQTSTVNQMGRPGPARI